MVTWISFVNLLLVLTCIYVSHEAGPAKDDGRQYFHSLIEYLHRQLGRISEFNKPRIQTIVDELEEYSLEDKFKDPQIRAKIIELAQSAHGTLFGASAYETPDQKELQEIVGHLEEIEKTGGENGQTHRSNAQTPRSNAQTPRSNAQTPRRNGQTFRKFAVDVNQLSVALLKRMKIPEAALDKLRIPDQKKKKPAKYAFDEHTGPLGTGPLDYRRKMALYENLKKEEKQAPEREEQEMALAMELSRREYALKKGEKQAREREEQARIQEEKDMALALKLSMEGLDIDGNKQYLLALDRSFGDQRVDKNNLYAGQRAKRRRETVGN